MSCAANALFNHIFVFCVCSNGMCHVDGIFPLAGLLSMYLKTIKYLMTQRNQKDGGGVRLRLGIYMGYSIK